MESGRSLDGTTLLTDPGNSSSSLSPPVSEAVDQLITVTKTVHFAEGNEDFYVYPRYDDLRPIAAGGQGLLVLACDGEKNVRVGIKKLPNVFKTESNMRPGLREARLLAFFNHKNILSLKDIILPFLPDAQGHITFDRHNLEVLGMYLVCELMECNLVALISSGTLQPKKHCQIVGH